MSKIDLRKEFKQLYQPSAKEVVVVDVPPMNYLMIDGEGDPNTSKEYAEAIEALFTLSYTIKFMVKKSPQTIDYSVMPLESLWPSLKKWTAMIMQPSFVSREIVERANESAKKKKELPALSRVRFEELDEGTCAQILHIGPYSAEGPTIAKLHAFIDARGQRTGRHHEIYLADPRRTAPGKLKTVIRQPMRVKPAPGTAAPVA